MLPPGRPPSKRPATGETPGHGRHATTLPEAGAPESHVTPSRPTCRMFTTLTLERVISINCEHAQCPWTFDSNAAQGCVASSRFIARFVKFCRFFPASVYGGQAVLLTNTFLIKFGKFGSTSDKIALFSFLRHKSYKHFTFIKNGLSFDNNAPRKPILFCNFLYFYCFSLCMQPYLWSKIACPPGRRRPGGCSGKPALKVLIAEPAHQL